MSRWTHVRGGMELVSGPYEYKPIKAVRPEGSGWEIMESGDKEKIAQFKKWHKEWFHSASLPYPEEQMVVSMPTIGTHFGKKDRKTGVHERTPNLSFHAYILSLPRARKHIQEAFSLIADNELALGVRYSLEQSIMDSRSSSSSLSYACDYKAYHNALERMYKSEDPFNSYTFKQLKEYLHVEDDPEMTEHVNSILVGMRDDIRYCSGIGFMQGLEKALNYLREHDISVEDGYLEWQDEYEPDLIYAWRSSRLEDTVWQFMVLDRKTNTTLWTKKVMYKKDSEGFNDYDNPELDVIEEGTLPE